MHSGPKFPGRRPGPRTLLRRQSPSTPPTQCGGATSFHPLDAFGRRAPPGFLGTLITAFSGVPAAVLAAEPAKPIPAPTLAMPAAVVACAQLRGDTERLACFDAAVGESVRGGASGPATPLTPAAEAAVSATTVPATVTLPVAASAASAPVLASSYLAEFWELDQARKRGTFNFSGYRPNYFLPVHVTSGINRTPDSPSPGHLGALPAYKHIESKMQISIRTKVLEDVGLPNADLWFAYTQVSQWQTYSPSLSTPFRSTDHEPEMTYVVPTPLSLPFGWSMKMVNLTLAHQSNGQSLPLSRSWNRVYAAVGVEHGGDFALVVRENKRLHESTDSDDNPDLTHYRGRTEFQGIWTPGLQTLSANWRTNFDSHGAIQVDWSLPVRRSDPKGLRWYLQVFSGYGESLVDYNFRQTSFGAGVSLFGW